MTAGGDGEGLRILVAAPRKSGGAQLRCMLAYVYGLGVGDARSKSLNDDAAEVPPGMVVATHQAYSPAFAASAIGSDVRLLAVVRHPYDLFTSNYLNAQHRDKRGGAASDEQTPFALLRGRPIDDLTVLGYLEDGFGEQISWLLGWQASGATLVSYERLIADPAQTLRALTEHIAPADDARVERAPLVCPAESLVRSRPGAGRRMPALAPGGWRDHLTEAHLAILRARYGDATRALGYEAS